MDDIANRIGHTYMILLYNGCLNDIHHLHPFGCRTRTCLVDISLGRSQRDAIQQNYVMCTKIDVAMNSLLQRSKCLRLNP